jgi:hypothetical protein
MGWIRGLHCEKCRHDFVARTSALIAPDQPILDRSFSSNETVWNDPKYEFEVHWGRSGALVAKNSIATSLHELVHGCHQFDPFCTEVHAVTKWSETTQNMSLGSNQVDRVCSLRKFWCDFIAWTCALLAVAVVRPILPKSSWSYQTVQNAPKHELGIQ